jgi:Undecaprenyl-phosphate galactose phosphotransferase WbaP
MLAFMAASLIFRQAHMVPTIIFPAGYFLQTGRMQLSIFALISVLFVGMRYLYGDYSQRQLFWESARHIAGALIIASLPDIFFLLAGGGQYSVFALVGTWVFLIVAIPVMRQVSRAAMSQLGLWQMPSMLIGSSQHAGEILPAISDTLALGFDLKAVLTRSPESELPASFAALRHIHSASVDETVRLVRQSGCAQAIVAAEDLRTPEYAQIVRQLMDANIPVVITHLLWQLPGGGPSAGLLFRRDVLLRRVQSKLNRLPFRFAKRAFDLLSGACLAVLLSPLFLFVAIAIKRYDGGPVFYSQRRIGRDGKPFKCMKFRTMVTDADERMSRWRVENPELYEEFLKTFKLRDDPRITPPGKWLRRTSLDELPQLLNVLRGEMSLVGPRPVVEKELRDYYGVAAELYGRVRPGMTGLWQVSGRSDTSYRERVMLDESYILNWAFLHDLVILIQTARIIVSGKGAF